MNRRRKKIPLRAMLVRKCSMEEISFKLDNMDKKCIDGEEQVPQMRCTSIESGMFSDNLVAEEPDE